jgi:glycosyltransferase involved in cell wall biosynthesis
LNNHPTNSYKAIIESDVVGLFSLFEGLPNAIIEGMASGKPIIATDISDIRYIVKNEENGIIINNTDAQSIAKALYVLLQLSTKELIEMGKKSRILALHYFSKKNTIEKYLNLI